ncbi:DUF2790 domain-containing protein [Pseudomonas abietaniphila]|uniref:DUF2790 domain-containing protein n=1 Tax=Pseudomonas abietaniphila TaxID=89065 RepID=A0A1G7RNE2_9PSED|nr:DUF2790 domain-containing protein [Pseudomonas abietaniphila]SDG12245.1 Protein of unknown function [Pseudomonas abietaniphila]
MKSKLTLAACLFAALNVCTFAARAEASSFAGLASAPDIQHVLSSSQEPSATCGLVTTHITYLDAKGQTRMLDYLKPADNCHNQNG